MLLVRKYARRSFHGFSMVYVMCFQMTLFGFTFSGPRGESDVFFQASVCGKFKFAGIEQKSITGDWWWEEKRPISSHG